MGRIVQIKKENVKTNSKALLVHNRCCEFLPAEKTEEDKQYRKELLNNLNHWFKFSDEVDRDLISEFIRQSAFNCKCGKTIHGYTLYHAIAAPIFCCFDDFSVYETVELASNLSKIFAGMDARTIVGQSYCQACKNQPEARTAGDMFVISCKECGTSVAAMLNAAIDKFDNKIFQKGA